MIGLAVGFSALIGVAGLYVGIQSRRGIIEEFDVALLAKAQALTALIDEEKGVIEFDYDSKSMPEFSRAERPEYFQIWLDDGSVLFRSERLTTDLPRGGSAPETRLLTDQELPDGRAGRSVQITFVPKNSLDTLDARAGSDAAGPPGPPQRGLVLVVARDREHLDRTLARTQGALLAAGAVSILLMLLLVQRALALGFRPIEAIAARVGAMHADALDVRFDASRAPRELAPIVEQLNALVGRLHDAFERERRFAGNVAHELRTPIAELRSLAAVGAGWPADEDSIVAFFGDVKGIATRMEHVIGDLMLLARCQAGVERVTSSPVNLRQMIMATWSGLGHSADTAGLGIRLRVPEDLWIETDRGKLSIMLTNLLGNAISYASKGSEIRCAAVRDGDGFQLDLTNRAAPMPEADLRHLAEPFWRGDASRSSPEHAGLGLTLVVALASLLRIDVRFGQDRDGTFRVRLRGHAGVPSRTAINHP